jgi:HEAT repeat protein
MRKVIIAFLAVTMALPFIACDLVAQPTVEEDPTFEGKTVKAWLEALRSNNYVARLEASKAMSKTGQKAIPQLMAALKDDDPTVRAIAARTIGQIGLDAKAAAPLLILCIDDKEQTVRRRAIFALGSRGLKPRRRSHA